MQHRIGLNVDLDSGDHEGHVSATLDRFNVLKFGLESLFDIPLDYPLRRSTVSECPVRTI